MSEYSAWGGKPDGSKDPPLRGQRPLPPLKPDPMRIMIETKADTSRIDQKLDELLEPPGEGEDKLLQIVELLQALSLKVEVIEARQARLEKLIVTSMGASSLAIKQIAAKSII